MDIGILLRGRSLEKVSKISDKFNTCYLTNDFNRELEKIKKFINGKQIVHFVNSMESAALPKGQYDSLNIQDVQFSFTTSMYKEKRKRRKTDLKKLYTGRNIKFLPEKYEPMTRSISNTGVCCIFFVSEIIKPDAIWITGLEFYNDNYLVKKNASHQLTKARKIGMVKSFVDIVKQHPQINYHILTYYKKLPKLSNLEILA